MTNEQTEVWNLYKKGYHPQEIANELKITINAVYKRLERIKKKNQYESSDMGNLTTDFSETKGTVSSKSFELKTVEDVLEYAKIDTNIWEVDRVKTNSWQMPRKNKEVDIKWENGRINGNVKDHGGFYVQTLWQITVFLKRKVKNPIESALKSINKDLYKNPPKIQEIKKSFFNSFDNTKHMLEISLVDHHFGKLLVDEDSSIEKSANLFYKAVKNLLKKSKNENIEKIVLPLGSDFFHIDNFNNATTAGTRQDVNALITEIYKVGCKSVIESIYLMRKIAPVKILWIPGNHDYLTSFFLCENIKQRFINVSDVSVDTSMKPRKYERYGINLIGYTHGKEEKLEALSRLILSENVDLLDGVKNIEFHKGHFHGKKQMNYIAAENIGNVKVRTLSSLSGNDLWHYKKGFINYYKAGEAFLFNKKHNNEHSFTCSINEIM